MNKKMVIIAGIICITTQLFSASGTTGVAFSKVSPSARASGMAEAFVGLADDSSAIWYNPAGLAKITKLSVGGTYGMLFEGLNFQYVSLAYPMKTGVIGGSVVMADWY
jgi:long-subunit fatty acid transport protein